MTQVVYKIVDAEGDQIDASLFEPGVDIPVQVVDVRINESTDTITYLLRYLHDKSDEELGEEVPRIVPREAD